MPHPVVVKAFLAYTFTVATTSLAPAAPPGQPHVPIWSAGNQNGNSILNWDPAKDSDLAFNRSFVPLAVRITHPDNVNANAHLDQGGVTTLTAFNLPTNNYSQGSATQNTYIPGFWQYMDQLVYWGGSASTGSILVPSAPVIDAGHRNGVRVLGNIFLPPVVYGGTLAEVEAFLQRDAGGRFPVADKMILAARTFSFDGYFINQETAGGSPDIAARMREFLTYFKANAPELHIQWYDAMDIQGNVGWKGALNDSNSPFFSTTINGKPMRVSDSMFLDFRWAGRPTSLADSARAAKALGRSPYELYSGVDFEGRNYSIARSVNFIFGNGGNHQTSLGIYRPEYTYNRASHNGLQPFYKADSTFWVGQNADPSNSTTSDAWKGIANYVPAQSVVKGTTFATNFNKGVGTCYMIDGVRLADGEWNNLSLQDVLPTYQWIVHTSGTKLFVGFDHEDAYNGGTSLLIRGKLDAANDIRLYQTELPVNVDSKIRIAIKPSQSTPPLKVAIAFADTPETWHYLDVDGNVSNTWQIATLDLTSYAGQTIIGLGLRIGDDRTEIADYSLHVGQLVVYRGHQSQPPPPTDLAIDNPEAVATACRSGDSIPLRVHWKTTTGSAYTYNLYRRNPDHSLVFLGATPNTAYFIPAIRRFADETSIDLEIETVAPDFGSSPMRSKLSVPVGWPKISRKLTPIPTH